ncbi:hypothetical protein [Candidatus Uabimicrobium amorphum]|uniref:Zinc-finger domain-containing protein n=1 Tax=Uabimicrobium amorphum TaxID=2596890 RepID=A0A5S9ITK8_UABAM|nr:hypothetical protein [Candidatus Uabimicrobium amorphum]BBM87859.1 hypothetical protein UABAM_06274 [Candidatus Uabimicrobium amorphum]
MKCEKVKEKYFACDHNQRIPLDVKCHTLFCSSCRKEIQQFSQHLSELQNTTPFEIEQDLHVAVMAEISRLTPPPPSPLSYSWWIFVGIFILASIFSMPYSNALVWLEWNFGRDLQIPLYSIMGLVLSIYISLFIGLHLEDVKRMSGYNKRDDSWS